MEASRRAFLGLGAAGLGTLVLSRRSGASTPRGGEQRRLIRPRRLAIGDAVGLTSPSRLRVTPADLATVTASLEGLGMQVTCGSRVGDCINDREVSDQEHAAELDALFLDPSVKAIIPICGGWGCARLLPYLDYELIRRHPKVLLGFSDVSALLLGIHARTGLVTFHGPMGISRWVPFTIEQMKQVVFEARAPQTLGSCETRRETVVPGRAEGLLLGGNLTVLTSILGSPYVATENDLILFLEEVLEPISEIDRMFTQLKLAGILDRVRGLVFGQCTGCVSPDVQRELTLEVVLRDYVVPRRIPTWCGAPIGHVDRQLTLPLGVRAGIDAARGTIQLLEPAVC
jgi:muramoyltetrapeptide carboxypeptidase